MMMQQSFASNVVQVYVRELMNRVVMNAEELRLNVSGFLTAAQSWGW